jgi:GNAT superfamily N-acetyltransferase
MSLYLRTATRSDAAPAGRICYEAFKTIAEHHRFPPDFPSREVATGLMQELVSRSDVHPVIAEMDGRVAGSNFLWERDTVAGVGPITVDPAFQNGSIGRQLMDAVLERASRESFRAVRLVQAAYHLRSLCLYTKLGFVVREQLAAIQGKAIETPIAGYEVRRAREEDLGAASEICRLVHGHDRTQELLDGVRKGSATVVKREQRITGYASEIGFFGHAVAETTEDLKALIAAATAFSGPGFLVPVRSSVLLRWCLEHGLRVVQPMTLMALGDYREPRGAFLPSVLY